MHYPLSIQLVKLNFMRVRELDNIKTEVITKLLCRFQNEIT